MIFAVRKLDWPLVSILIPAYNAEKYIAETLRSALAQTWKRTEIIVVDDGSKDATAGVAETFKSSNVVVVRQSNQGASAARNRALSLAQGEYIQYLDADDLLAPDKIERQMAEAKGTHTLLSSAWGEFLYREETAEFKPSALWNDLSPVEWLLRKMSNNLHMQTATWLVTRELTEAAGPWDERISLDDDGEYFCRVVHQSEGIHFVPESKVYYRATPNSLSYVGLSNKKLDSQWLSMNRHISHLLQMEDSPRSKAACLAYLHTWLPHFYPERMDLVKEMEQVAYELKGELKAPSLSWKYAWIGNLFGYGTGKRASLLGRRLRCSVARAVDRALRAVSPAG
jgi:glycosyltransferase involved in cell wall biosynthesis